MTNNPFSKEKLENYLNSDDKKMSSLAEEWLGVCKYPDNYWVMPDYYYPGVYYNIHRKAEAAKENPKLLLFPDVLETRTSNDLILEDNGFSKKSLSSFDSFLPISENSIEKIEFLEDEKIKITNSDKTTTIIPFSLLCAIFLKARELEYSRPSCLDKAGPKDKVLKDKWLKNQEVIKELQAKTDE